MLFLVVVCNQTGADNSFARSPVDSSSMSHHQMFPTETPLGFYLDA